MSPAEITALVDQVTGLGVVWILVAAGSVLVVRWLS